MWGQKRDWGSSVETELGLALEFECGDRTKTGVQVWGQNQEWGLSVGTEPGLGFECGDRTGTSTGVQVWGQNQNWSLSVGTEPGLGAGPECRDRTRTGPGFEVQDRTGPRPRLFPLPCPRSWSTARPPLSLLPLLCLCGKQYRNSSTNLVPQLLLFHPKMKCSVPSTFHLLLSLDWGGAWFTSSINTAELPEAPVIQQRVSAGAVNR